MDVISLVTSRESVANFVLILLLVALIAPGFFIAYVRSRYISGRLTAVSSAAVEYVLISSVYYSVSLPIFFSVGWMNWFSISILLFFLPVFVGIFLGGLAQWGWAKKLGNIFGLNLVTHLPTAWDGAFGTLKQEVWVCVHTHDMGVIIGWLGPDSHASTDLSRRDLYLEKISVKNSALEASEERGIWIKEDQIRAVEIVKRETVA